MNNKWKLLIINGPFCSEKQEVGNVFSQLYDFIHIDGSTVLQSLQESKKTNNSLLDYNDIHADILWKISSFIEQWKNVVLSHTILPSYEVLYQYYLQKNKIDYNMMILLPDIDMLLKKNSLLDKSFDEEFLWDMYQLFSEETTWKNKTYQYDSTENPVQIAETLYMCFFPQLQKNSFFDLSFISSNTHTISFAFDN